MKSRTGLLVIRLEGNVVRREPLTMEVVRIGRLPDNDLVLPHPMVSGRHAELRWERTGLTLIDLGSKKGTFLEKARLQPDQPCHLAPGLSFTIGPFVLTYEAEGATPGVDQDDLGEMPPREATHEVLLAMNTPAADAAAAPAAPPRPSYPAPLAQGPLSRYLYDLPAPYHENDFLGGFLLIFESLWEPLEWRQDAIDLYFDPRTCPGSLLPWLASWVNLTLGDHWPEARQRGLVAEAMELYRWRGTRYGLRRLIELHTGLSPEISDAPDAPFVFHIRLSVPPDGPVSRTALEALIHAHKPAHAGYTLEIVP